MVGAVRLQFGVAEDDVISVCEHVEVGANPPTYHCNDAVPTSPVPERVRNAVELLIESIDYQVVAQIDPTICPVVAGRVPSAGPLFVNDEGDVYLFGDLRWDCPPYGPAA